MVDIVREVEYWDDVLHRLGPEGYIRERFDKATHHRLVCTQTGLICPVLSYVHQQQGR